MTRFAFLTNAFSESYCDAIVEAMVRFFGISEEEAIGRVNRLWQGSVWVSDTDIRYHEDPDDWAKFIYYEEGSRWWVTENPPKPRPYP